MSLQDFCDLVGTVYGPLFHAEFEDYCRRREEGEREGEGGRVRVCVCVCERERERERVE